jgi:hypothetical protein
LDRPTLQIGRGSGSDFSAAWLSAALHTDRAVDDIDSWAARPRGAHAHPRCPRRPGLRRVQRDAAHLARCDAAGRHAMINPLVIEEVYGKALLGFSPEEQITDLI